MRAPEALTMAPACSQSARSSFWKSSDDEVAASTPRRTKRYCTAGSAITLMTAALMRSTSALGVPAGASRPIHESNL